MVPPFGELPLDGVVATLRSELDRAMGLDPALRDAEGTTVTSSGQLEGSGIVIVTAAERHRVVWCDPGVEATLADLADGRRSTDPGDLAAEVRSRGASEVGTSVLHVVHRRGLRDVEVPEGATFEHRPVGEVHAAIDRLVAACPVDEVVEAGFDDLPDHAHLTLGCEPDGEPVVAVVRRRIASAPSFGDLGVLVRPSATGRGWGAGAASLAARECFAAGRLPLCRCEARHGASLRLAARLGFRRVGELRVSRFAAQTRTSSSDTSSGGDVAR